MMSKKKYDPLKEIKKITGSTTGVLVGTYVVGSIGSLSTHTPAGVYTGIGLMGKMPVVQAGGSLLRSLEMLNPPKRKKKR